MNISSPNTSSLPLPLPEGFSASREPRKKVQPEPLLDHESQSFRPTLFAASVSSDVRKQLYHIEISDLEFSDPETCNLNFGFFPQQVALPKIYCIRSPLPVQQPVPIRHSTILDSTVTFTVDRDICILGAQVC